MGQQQQLAISSLIKEPSVLNLQSTLLLIEHNIDAIADGIAGTENVSLILDCLNSLSLDLVEAALKIVVVFSRNEALRAIISGSICFIKLKEFLTAYIQELDCGTKSLYFRIACESMRVLANLCYNSDFGRTHVFNNNIGPLVVDIIQKLSTSALPKDSADYLILKIAFGCILNFISSNNEQDDEDELHSLLMGMNLVSIVNASFYEMKRGLGYQSCDSGLIKKRFEYDPTCLIDAARLIAGNDRETGLKLTLHIKSIHTSSAEETKITPISDQPDMNSVKQSIRDCLTMIMRVIERLLEDDQVAVDLFATTNIMDFFLCASNSTLSTNATTHKDDSKICCNHSPLEEYSLALMTATIEDNEMLQQWMVSEYTLDSVFQILTTVKCKRFLTEFTKVVAYIYAKQDDLFTTLVTSVAPDIDQTAAFEKYIEKVVSILFIDNSDVITLVVLLLANISISDEKCIQLQKFNIIQIINALARGYAEVATNEPCQYKGLHALLALYKNLSICDITCKSLVESDFLQTISGLLDVKNESNNALLVVIFKIIAKKNPEEAFIWLTAVTSNSNIADSDKLDTNYAVKIMNFIWECVKSDKDGIKCESVRAIYHVISTLPANGTQVSHNISKESIDLLIDASIYIIESKFSVLRPEIRSGLSVILNNNGLSSLLPLEKLEKIRSIV